MSYNGVGLLTPRGSGTSGYVQRNLSYVRARNAYMTPVPIFTEDQMARPVNKKPCKEILDHDRRRQVEVQLLAYREELEKKG